MRMRLDSLFGWTRAITISSKHLRTLLIIPFAKSAHYVSNTMLVNVLQLLPTGFLSYIAEQVTVRTGNVQVPADAQVLRLNSTTVFYKRPAGAVAELSFQNAKAHCASFGGRLVEIYDNYENRQIYDWVRTIPLSGRFWIGL